MIHENIIKRGNLVVYYICGKYRIGWIIGQERDGTYAILDESGKIYKHIFANKSNSNFTIKKKLTKQYLQKYGDNILCTRKDLPDILDIIKDDTIEGWSDTHDTNYNTYITNIQDDDNLDNDIDNINVDNNEYINDIDTDIEDD